MRKTAPGTGAAGAGMGARTVVLTAALTLVAAVSPWAAQEADAPPEAAQEGATSPLGPGETPAPQRAPQTQTREDVSDGEGESRRGRTGEAVLTDPELFLRANQAYEEGDYRRAIALYRELLDRGHDDGHLHYNLGNAYLRVGEPGPAIAAYRRSLRRLPRDQDVRANLEFARRTTKDALAPPTPPAWVSTLFFWHFQMSRRELAWTVVVLNLLLWGLLALWLLRRGSEVLPWLVGGVLLFLLGSGGSLLVHELWPQRVAVVLPPEVEARSGPGADAVVRFKLHAGTEVAVEDVTDGWVRIAGPDGEQAWVEDDRVAVVRW